jgi:hypothetical protein
MGDLGKPLWRQSDRSPPVSLHQYLELALELVDPLGLPGSAQCSPHSCDLRQLRIGSRKPQTGIDN